MGQGISGGGGGNPLDGIKNKRINALVITDVKVIEKTQEVIVPRFTEKIVEVPKYVEKEIIVHDVKVVPVEVETQNVKVVDVEKEVSVPRYIEEEVKVPKFIPHEIIEPYITRQEKIVEVPRIIEKIKIVEIPIEVKVYKLIEDEVHVPKIIYKPVIVEKVEWKLVPKERCKHCMKEIE